MQELSESRLIENDILPFECIPTLKPLIDYWRDLASRRTGSGGVALARSSALIAAWMEQVPRSAGELAIESSIHDVDPGLVEELMTAIFPSALDDVVIGAVLAPQTWYPFYRTPAFEAVLTPTWENLLEEHHETLQLSSTMSLYHRVLHDCFGLKVLWDIAPVIPIMNRKTGLPRYYRLALETRFIRIKQRNDARQLSDEEIHALLEEPMNQLLWMRMLPPELFEFQGFIVLTLFDVTEQHVLSMLKDELLEKDPMSSSSSMDHFTARLRTLLGLPDVQVGFISLDPDDEDIFENARVVGKSLLLADGFTRDSIGLKETIYGRAAHQDQPFIIRDLRSHTSFSPVETQLIQRGINSVILAPLRVEGQPVGLLELGSPLPGALDMLSAHKLERVLSLFATALKRSVDEHEDHLQAIIKQHYTAIHPVVEWRFREAALHFVEEQASSGAKGRHSIEPIVFKNVIPLYGLSDIRGSSMHRSEAVRADLTEQLDLARTVIHEAYRIRNLPALAELEHLIGRYKVELEAAFSVESESSVLHFLQNSIEPHFQLVERYGSAVAESIEAYHRALDPELGFVYRRRRLFEDSVTLINNTIASYLEEKERDAQRLFPHYFELYKTDGVDYNIYAGEALVEDGQFSELQFESLRIWQLETMCDIARAMQLLKPQLPLPLETAHLILVHSTPMSIRFRLEEKQFDADGAYNVRYDIIKKRIDKACIKGTGERLTQPDKIAVVYTSVEEARVYRRFFDYLIAERLLEEGVEHFELEEMPGASGLKALRVSVLLNH